MGNCIYQLNFPNIQHSKVLFTKSLVSYEDNINIIKSIAGSFYKLESYDLQCKKRMKIILVKCNKNKIVYRSDNIVICYTSLKKRYEMVKNTIDIYNSLA